jgi:hypothetical protein
MIKLVLFITSILFSAGIAAQGLNDSLIAHYPLENNTKDIVSGADGIITAAVPSKDRHGSDTGAYYFNGLSNINMGDSTLFEMGLNDYSISVWFKSYNKGSKFTYVLGKRGWNSAATKDKVYSLILSNRNELLFYYKFDDYSGLSYPTSNSLDTNWHHAVVTIDRSASIKLYIDKVMVATTNISSKSSQTMNCENGDFMLGNCTNRNEALSGMVDDVRIYKGKVLTNKEISDAFNEQYTSISAINFDLSYSLYPNPTVDVIKLELKDNAAKQGSTYHIYSINSQLLSSGAINSKVQEINTSSLASGHYFLVVLDRNGNRLGHNKFIKE